jgi:hypothetical protein
MVLLRIKCKTVQRLRIGLGNVSHAKTWIYDDEILLLETVQSNMKVFEISNFFHRSFLKV